MEDMENAQRCRAIALLCRQQASIHPDQNWKWLAQAERWEHLAEAELEAHFRARNAMMDAEAKVEPLAAATNAAA